MTYFFVREFVHRESRLPVSGVIPDMFSDSERFIQLQNIYRERAREDVEVLCLLLRLQTSFFSLLGCGQESSHGSGESGQEL